MDTLVTRALKKNGLIYVQDSDPGITRLKSGKGFRYRFPDREPVRDTSIIQRIKSLGIPPAYKDVWICLKENGHLQATGMDARGRKQYRYHTDWQALRGERKFDQLLEFAECLPAIRRRSLADIERSDSPETVTLAAIVLLLDATFLRVGNRSYLRDNGTYGATTLLKRHVKFGKTIDLKFKAKGGNRVQRTLKQPRLQKILEEIADLPGKQLFVWQDADAKIHPVDSSQLNEYLARIAGQNISAKTFRTWGGTLAAFSYAVRCLARNDTLTLKAMCNAASVELCNTPAICRKSYIHPSVLALANDEKAQSKLVALTQKPGTRTAHMRKDEVLLRDFLS